MLGLIIKSICDVYVGIIIIYVLMSWIPNMRGVVLDIYNMLGKFAAIIGPMLVGVVTLLTGSHRAGILSLVILFLVGGILLHRVDEDEAVRAREAFEKEAR